MRLAGMTGPAGRLASIRFRAGIGGEPVLQEMQSSAVHAFEPTPWGSWVTTSPGHPAPGTQSGMRVSIGVGCCAEIRSRTPVVAGTSGRSRGSGGRAAPSALSVQATVASDGMLSWNPGPAAAADGCYHRRDNLVQLASNARLLWRDEFATESGDGGRAGTWRSRLRVTRDGWPVVASELAVGPGWPLWNSPAVLGGARVVSVMVVVDPGHSAGAWAPARIRQSEVAGVALPLNGPGVQIVAWGPDMAGCRAVVASLIEPAGVPGWAAGRWSGGRRFERAGA